MTTLYYCLSSEDDRATLLTRAHVFPNTSMTRKNNSQPRKEIVALGNEGYRKAVMA